MQALYSEIASMESTLRTHNVMKMAVFGVLNKKKSNLSAISFEKYVFSLENGTVRYYVMEGVGKGDEEGSFPVINVYDVGTEEQVIKRSKLESLLTLGMGNSTMDETSTDEDKRFPFKISLLQGKDSEDMSEREQLRQELLSTPVAELTARAAGNGLDLRGSLTAEGEGEDVVSEPPVLPHRERLCAHGETQLAHGSSRCAGAGAGGTRARGE